MRSRQARAWVVAALRGWTRRYLLMDLAGLAGALALGCAAGAWSGRTEVAAAGAVVGDTASFYTAAWLCALARARRNGHGTKAGALFRDLVLEFAPAELIDVALVRPVALLLATRLLGSTALGITLGSLAADLVFYLNAGWSAFLVERRVRSSIARLSEPRSSRRNRPRGARGRGPGAERRDVIGPRPTRLIRVTVTAEVRR